MQSDQEIEVKFKIDDLDLFENKIIEVGGKLVFDKVFQETIRFDTPEEDLQKRGTFIRVRSGEKNTMTLKKKLHAVDAEYKERLELEMEIGSIEMATKILEELGYSRKFIMQKYRTEYALSGTILALDRLPFGNYIEIEGGKSQIESTILQLGIDGSERLTGSYWHLFDEYNKGNGVVNPSEDIVFG